MSVNVNFNQVCFLFVVLVFVTQQVSLPFAHDLPVILFIPFSFVIVSFFLSPRDVSVTCRPELLFLFILSTTSALFHLVFGAGLISINSYIYLLLIYLIFIFKVGIPKFFDYYVLTVLVISFFGIIQFFIQKIGLNFVHFADILPAGMTISGFNLTYETYYESGLFKPNGFFCLEPSYYSQFVAFAIIIEMMTQRRFIFLLFFLIARFTSFSGTGFLLLILFFVNILVVEKRIGNFIAIVFFSALVFGCSFFLFSSELSFIVDRLSEFGSSDTSANIRFIAPYVALFEYIGHLGLSELFFGSGAGVVDEIRLINDVVNYPATVKAFIEYGLPFFLSYFWFIVHLIRKEVPQYLFLPLIGFVFVTSGSLLQPSVVIFLWFCSNSFQIKNYQ